MKLVHRFSLSGRFMCGKTEGYGSSSGVAVTCPECQEKSRPMTREEGLRAISKACQKAVGRKEGE